MLKDEVVTISPAINFVQLYRSEKSMYAMSRATNVNYR